MRKHFTTRLPDQLAQALTERAEVNHRSANAELTAILTGAAPALSGTVPLASSTVPPQLVGAAVFTPSGVIARRLVDSDVSIMARTMSNRFADACNVDREDYWKQYGQECIEDTQAMVDSVRGAI